MVKLFAYTDGACSGNPGPGGWGVVLVAMQGDKVIKTRELCGGEAQTTNNKMELRAAIESLNALKERSEITIITDSTYVKDGITKWIHGWKARNWQKKGGLKNVDLWQALDKAVSQHTVSWQWVKGHAGHEKNEQADALARKGMQPYKA